MTPNVIKQQATGNIFADTYRVRNGNSIGRKYNIKGLHTFLKDFPMDVPEDIREDLASYERYRKRRKARWESRKRSSKLEQAKVAEQVL